MTEAELQELKSKVDTLWEARIRIDMPLVERNVICDISKKCGKSTYGGNVTSAGAAGTFFPTAWSVTKTATGVYTITHNLGTLLYSVVATADTNSRVAYISGISDTTFVISVSNFAGTLTDTATYFILTK